MIPTIIVISSGVNIFEHEIKNMEDILSAILPIPLFGKKNYAQNVYNVQQEFLTKITNDNTQTCTTSVVTIQDDNIVMVSGDTIAGDLYAIGNTGTQISSSCAITSTMDTNVSNIMSSIAEQVNSSDSSVFGSGLFSGGKDQDNTVNVKQNIANIISNVNNELCNTSIMTSQENNFIYVTDTTVGGNLYGIVNSGETVSSSCNMNNYMKTTTYNQAQSSSSQSLKFKSFMGELVGALALIAVIIIILLIVVSLLKAFGKKPTDPNQQGKQGQGDNLNAHMLTNDQLINLLDEPIPMMPMNSYPNLSLPVTTQPMATSSSGTSSSGTSSLASNVASSLKSIENIYGMYNSL